MENEQPIHDTANAPRPVVYVRSATDGDGQLRQRVEDAQELARMCGLDVAQEDIIAEHGSGADIGRQGLQSILQKAERGEISHLVCRDWTRLSQNQRDLRQILVTLAEAGVTVVTEVGNNLPPDVYEMISAVSSLRR